MPDQRRSQRNLLIGDVLEIRTKAGIAYAQCTHRDSFLGPLIRVIAGTHAAPCSNISDIVNSKNGYHVFIWWNKDVNHSVVRKIDRLPVPEAFKAFPLFKAGVTNPTTGKVTTWWLWDGKKEWKVGKLKASEKGLPRREVWNYALLVERIELGWHPRDDAK